MLLRQALEQTRAGMPTPVLFNSRIVPDRIDEVSAKMQKEVFDVRFHNVHNRASIRSFRHGSGGRVSQAR